MVQLMKKKCFLPLWLPCSIVLCVLTSVAAEEKSVDARLYPTSKSLISDECAEDLDSLAIRYRSYELASVPCGEKTATLEKQTTSLPDGFGVDLLVEPLLWFQFGRFDDPIESAVGIMPRARFYMWRGSMIDIRPNFTIRDELHQSPGYQGGLYVASQVIQPARNHLVQGSIGAFTADRWGVDAQWVGSFLASRLFGEVQVGGTGYLSWDDSIYSFSALDRITGVGRVGWYVTSVDLLAQVEAGRYLWKDWGGGVTLDRRFGVMGVSLSCFYTPRGVNGGFAVKVPLWCGAHPHAGRLRFGFSDSYRFRYRFKGYQPPASVYETGSEMRDKFIEYQSVTKMVEF